MQYGSLLLSKVIDSNDVKALDRYGLSEKDFPTESERKAYKYLLDYAEKNRGEAPSYATVASEVPGFDDWYVPQISDGYDFLTKKIKGARAKNWIVELINGKTNEKTGNFEEGALSKNINEISDGIDVLKWLKEEVEHAILRTDVRDKIGTDLKSDAESFLAEYQRRKAGESFKIWKSKFPSINEHVGGYLSGNMYTWHGRSGRGKSVFTMEEAIEAAMQGANVLIWAMEMSRFEWMARAYSCISARAGIVNANIDGVDYEAGFENRALLTGGLSDEFEVGFEVFLLQMAEGDYMPGNITLRAADDAEFFNRGVKQLEADILATKADVVVVDPIYLMDYEANTSKVAGGDVANTSKRIRRLAGLTGAVVHVITQADEVKDDRDDEGNRELRPPKRAEIKKTKAVLEDAANVFGIDTLDGAGIIEIGKGRNGGEGTQVEVLYLPNYGIVREVETGEAAVSQFEF
jgi:replicative DNA helicase